MAEGFPLMAGFLFVRVYMRHIDTADNGDRTIILTTRIGEGIHSINITTISAEAWDALSNAAPDDEGLEY